MTARASEDMAQVYLAVTPGQARYIVGRRMGSIGSWLGLGQTDTPEHAPLRELVQALERLEPGQARHLARFAYLLGRVAHADRHISREETETMERLVRDEGGLSADQAMLVVSLAKASNLIFGATADFEVAREFTESAAYPEKLALARCLFAVAATDASISMVEETEIHRILNQLRIEPSDLTALRVAHRKFLPGLAPPPPSPERA
jgi:uncharacterized tellurite resistance protein B-like protein